MLCIAFWFVVVVFFSFSFWNFNQKDFHKIAQDLRTQLLQSLGFGFGFAFSLSFMPSPHTTTHVLHEQTISIAPQSHESALCKYMHIQLSHLELNGVFVYAFDVIRCVSVWQLQKGFYLIQKFSVGIEMREREIGIFRVNNIMRYGATRVHAYGDLWFRFVRRCRSFVSFMSFVSFCSVSSSIGPLWMVNFVSFMMKYTNYLSFSGLEK